MKFFDILLKEGRKEDLKKKYSTKFNEEDLDFILNISDLIDFNHKYTDFVLKNLNPNASADEIENLNQIEEVIELVKDFDKYQKNLEKKDINQYLSFEELDKALFPLKVKEKERELENQTEKIYEDDNFLVLIPKTIESSCKYGSGTKWCTTIKGADHFKRYTSGKQGLYYIIRKKGKQTEPHYKVAVHFNDIGGENWWDARDHKMGEDTVTLFKDYFPELYQAISDHHEQKRKIAIKDLDRIFEVKDESFEIYENFHDVANEDLKISIAGYDLISDMPGKAVGNLKISLNGGLLDKYDVFVNYSPKGNNQFTASVGFSEEFDDTPLFDFKLWEGWGYDVTLNLNEESRISFDRILLRNVHNKIFRDVNFEKLLKKITGPTWNPNRINYGYTFGKNKGLIKKLVDWLDSGVSGTKLDFLVNLGVFQKVNVDGKTKFKRPNSEHLYSQNDLRGQYSSFFASAKHAGILDYKKSGKEFILGKGPNFDAFKRGELRAL